LPASSARHGGPRAAPRQRASRPRDRSERRERAAPRERSGRIAQPPPWWTSTGAAAAASAASGPSAGLALTVTALVLLAFSLMRGLLTVADGPPAEPARKRLERPG
jgi:hypothetical protein